MATHEKKDMTGALFTNNGKKTDKQPDYTGEVMVADTLYKLAGWLRVSKKGTRYLSLAVSLPKTDVEVRATPDGADEIPF